MISNFYNNKEINDTIKQALNQAFMPFKKEVYAYAIMDKKEPLKIAIINNYPVWFDIYLKNHYQLIDPVIIKSLKTVQDFPWEKETFIPYGHTTPDIFDAAKKHSIASGHTFVLHDYKNNLTVLSLIGFEKYRIGTQENREKIQSLFISIHQKMLRLYDTVQKSSANRLSLRECEVLYWIGVGKTYFETSIILGISQRTVKFHIHNIIKKLGVSNARHAVKLSIDLDLLNNKKLNSWG